MLSLFETSYPKPQSSEFVGGLRHHVVVFSGNKWMVEAGGLDPGKDDVTLRVPPTLQRYIHIQTSLDHANSLGFVGQACSVLFSLLFVTMPPRPRTYHVQSDHVSRHLSLAGSREINSDLD